MRQTIITALLMLTLTVSCTKTASDGYEAWPIGFGVSDTKAIVNMPAGAFSVVGKRCSGEAWVSSNAQNVFATDIQNVSTDGSGACVYSPVQYWKANNVYRFRAISPTAPFEVAYSDDLDGNAVITNFKVNATATAQMDLLLSDRADVVMGATIGAPALVGLVFHHLLSNIHIQICEDTSEPVSDPGSDTFTITGVTLSGMPDRGTYTGTSTAGSWNTVSAASLSCVNNTTHIAPDSFTGPECEVWPNGLLLIPQTINSSNAVNLVLSYQVSHNGDAASNKSVSIPIPDIVWEAGKRYVYQLSLSEESYIKFGNISVDTWGNPQTSGSIIIR